MPAVIFITLNILLFYWNISPFLSNISLFDCRFAVFLQWKIDGQLKGGDIVVTTGYNTWHLFPQTKCISLKNVLLYVFCVPPFNDYIFLACFRKPFLLRVLRSWKCLYIWQKICCFNCCSASLYWCWHINKYEQSFGGYPFSGTCGKINTCQSYENTSWSANFAANVTPFSLITTHHFLFLSPKFGLRNLSSCSSFSCASWHDCNQQGLTAHSIYPLASPPISPFCSSIFWAVGAAAP